MKRADLFLHLLREAGDRGITSRELLLAGVGSRYGARLLELRGQGHVIETKRTGTDPQTGAVVFTYRLLHEAGTRIAPVEATTTGAVGAPGASSSPSAEALFDVPAVPRSPYDVTEDAA